MLYKNYVEISKALVWNLPVIRLLVYELSTKKKGYAASEIYRHVSTNNTIKLKWK